MQTATLRTKDRRDLRLKQAQFGLWLFFATQSMLFASMLVAKGMLLGPGQAVGVDIVGPVVMTVVLLISSITVQLAEQAAREQKLMLSRQMLGATLALGGVFVVGLAWVWLGFPYAYGTPWGLLFYTMTGLHGVHLLVGMGLVGWTLVRVGQAVDAPMQVWGVQRTARFWHFLGVMWLIYFAALYIV